MEWDCVAEPVVAFKWLGVPDCFEPQGLVFDTSGVRDFETPRLHKLLIIRWIQREHENLFGGK
jgi:hypothetical protein